MDSSFKRDKYLIVISLLGVILAFLSFVNSSLVANPYRVILLVSLGPASFFFILSLILLNHPTRKKLIVVLVSLTIASILASPIGYLSVPAALDIGNFLRKGEVQKRKVFLIALAIVVVVIVLDTISNNSRLARGDFR